MDSNDLQSSASSSNPSVNNKSSTPLTSPVRSRDPSPARVFTSPPVLQPKDPRVRATNDVLAGGARAPRPLSLNEAASKLSKAEVAQDNPSASGSSTMRWPTSPRLKSPPASTSSRRNSGSSVKLPEPDNIESDMGQQAYRPLVAAVDPGSKSPVVGAAQSAALKVPRGFSGLTSTLETVQEGDQSSSPSNTTDQGPLAADKQRLADRQQPADKVRSNTLPEIKDRDGNTDAADGEPDATRSKDALKSPTQLPPPGKKAPPAVVSAKVRPSTEGSSQNMIVETETVASIPQSSTGPNNVDRSGAAKRDDNGPLRAKASSELIKTKKDKKKTVQKRPSATAGQTSSKADIFEAKVTSAAEDDESDSDETFIYESNPPESKSRPSRHHSRTPSANSMRSLADRKHPSRAVSNLTESQRGVRAKRSMKFASNSYAADDESVDRDHGTVRAHRNKTASSSGHHHMHGFSTDGHQAAGEEESPFSQASKLRNAVNMHSSRNSSKVHTPKSGSPPPYSMTPTKPDQSSPYNYETRHAFSERDPLLGSLQASRARPPRNSNLRHIAYYNDHRAHQKGFARRCAGCFVVMVIVTIVLMVAAAFLFATTHPLYGVELVEIQDILATEESLMANLMCIATNPNILPISITDMDVNIFAKSTHVSPHSHSRLRKRHARRDTAIFPRSSIHPFDNVDDGTDPITDPSTMLLGRILQLDSALMFEASPLRHTAHNSTGELRLEKPGNSTEADGSERWERVIQFPFELIVRGVLKYTLPLSSRVVTNAIKQTAFVDPADDDDDDGSGEGHGAAIARGLARALRAADVARGVKRREI